MILPSILGAIAMGVSPVSASADRAEAATLGLLTGSETAMRGFEQAARRCGLNGVSRVKADTGKGTWVRVSGSPAQIGSDPHLACAMRYLMSHLSGNDPLVMLGNERAGR